MCRRRAAVPLPSLGKERALGLVLENDRLRLGIEPAVGGSVVGWEARVDGAWTALLRPSPKPLARSSDASSFTLAPYSNRVRDGVFGFEGVTYRLQHPEKHAIHGDVRDRPWRVVTASREEARLELRSADFADFNFPFPIVCSARFALEGADLTMSLRVENAGSERMPAGCGFHPYFRRSLGAAETPELEMRVAGVYPGTTPLPEGAPVPLAPGQDFSCRSPLPEGLDHCFAGWDGRARIRWPASGVAVEVAAAPPLSHLVLYTPPGEPFFALEPVTNANDGFNLLTAGVPGTGVLILAPGEALDARVRLRVFLEA